jgi:hypothetical protein
MSRWDAAACIRIHVPAGIYKVVEQTQYTPSYKLLNGLHLWTTKHNNVICTLSQAPSRSGNMLKFPSGASCTIPFTFREISSFLLSEYDALVQTVQLQRIQWTFSNTWTQNHFILCTGITLFSVLYRVCFRVPDTCTATIMPTLVPLPRC